MSMLIDVNNKYDRICFFLTFLSRHQLAPDAPWAVKRTQKDHVDEMGVAISRSERYFVRRDRADRVTLRKLSLQSAQLLWDLFIDDDDLGNRMVQKMLEAEEEELRRLGYGPSEIERMRELRAEDDDGQD